MVPTLGEQRARAILNLLGSSLGPNVDEFATLIGRLLADARVSVEAFPGFVADGVTNIDPAVQAAIAAGFRRLWIPKNTLWIPPDNTVPGGLDIMGEDWETTVISVADRANDNRIKCGPKTTIWTCAFISKWHDTENSPQGTQKTAPSYFFVNASGSVQDIGAWAFKGITVVTGPVTDPNGVAIPEVPGIGAAAEGNGADAFYAASRGLNTSGIRILTSAQDTANPSRAIYILNGQETEENANIGLWIRSFSTGALSSQLQSAIRVDRIGGEPSIFINDADLTGDAAKNWMVLNPSKVTSGNIINVSHTASAWTGHFIFLNAGQSGGSHTGDFLRYANGGVKFRVRGPDGSMIAGAPASANSLTVNSTFTVSAPTDTSLRFSVRHADGTTRTYTLAPDA